MSANTDNARANGAAARRLGAPFTDNPHPLGTSVCQAWSKGWNAVDREISAAQKVGAGALPTPGPRSPARKADDMISIQPDRATGNRA